jgi:hypothetical protein
MNYKTVLTTSLIFGVFAIVCYLGAFAYSEGGEGFFITLLHKLFYLFAFPALYMLRALHIETEWSFVAGLIFNCFFYGFLFERILLIIQKKRAAK